MTFERGECVAGISCVAAAVRGPEEPLASISLVGDGRAPLETVAPLVVDSARQASRALFPQLEENHRASRRAEVAQDNWSPETMDRFLAAGQYGDWL